METEQGRKAPESFVSERRDFGVGYISFNKNNRDIGRVVVASDKICRVLSDGVVQIT
jgi:hypothetical protein